MEAVPWSYFGRNLCRFNKVIMNRNYINKAVDLILIASGGSIVGTAITVWNMISMLACFIIGSHCIDRYAKNYNK